MLVNKAIGLGQEDGRWPWLPSGDLVLQEWQEPPGITGRIMKERGTSRDTRGPGPGTVFEKEKMKVESGRGSPSVLPAGLHHED